MSGKRKRLSAVIFDMDGLMLDTEIIYQTAWRNAGQELGYILSDKLLHATTGRPAHDCYRLLLEEQGEDFPLAQFNAASSVHWEKHVTTYGIAQKPGLCELLDLLEQYQIPRAVATSTAYTKALFTLRAGGIETRFKNIVTGDQIQHGKPAPDIFLAAAKKLNVDPHECIALEDSEAGVIAASTAGMYTIMVPDIKQPSPEVAARANQVMASLHDVCQLLKAEWLP